MEDSYDYFERRGKALAWVVMGKVPRPGRVKTRLCPPLALGSASELYAGFLADVVAQTRQASRGSVVLALAPGGDAATLAPWLPEDVLVRRQVGADLGARMVHSFEERFAAGAGAVFLRNSDSPSLPTAILDEAARALERPDVDVVFGPDHGGGYYLVGLKRSVPALFLDVPMSVRSMYERTLTVARDLGLRVHEVRSWLDVDEYGDLLALVAELGDAGVAARCPNTVRALHRLGLPVSRDRS